MHWPAWRLGIAPPGGGERLLAVEIFPGADQPLALLDPVETDFDEGFGGQPAIGDLARGFPNSQGAKIGHAALHCFWGA